MEVTIIEPADLTAPEATRLAELEVIIGTGMRSFVDVGTALAEVRDSDLYRATYPTFEAYVKDRWGWNRGNAYQYIDAAAVQRNVLPGVQLPTMTHARLLAAFGSEDQRWMAEEIAPLTVREAVKRIQKWRDEETNTDPVSIAARKEVREALHSEDALPEVETFTRSAERLMASDRQLPGAEMVRVATTIQALAAWYTVQRASRA